MQIEQGWFKDEQGRTLILRGANLGGSSKVPARPDGATWRREGFFEHRDVSFVGRPFPLDEADEHYSRLRSWGLTFCRFLTTWEAIEHAGPGEYDEEYLDYLRAVVKKAGDYGISVFIDPHQDVWSRWTGGDGAPGWTLEMVGMDLTRLHRTGAAISHATHGDPYPRMIWPTNYAKYGAATMFTLFFAGSDFAPATQIEGVPAQEFLQSHYLNAVRQVVQRLRDLPHVVGYDSLNEPGGGYIGAEDAGAPFAPLLAMDAMPTPFQAMLAASGYPQTVDVYNMGFAGPEVTGQTTINPDGVSLWRDGYECVWKANGVWDDDGGAPRLLRPDHFARKPDGSPADAANDYIKPFILRFIREIRSDDPDAIIFFEGVPDGGTPRWTADDPGQVVNAGHWYDGVTLFTKQFNPEFTINLRTRQPVMGAEAVAQTFVDEYAALKQESAEGMGGVPTLVGEFGIPFDLDEKSGYRTGDFSLHTQALRLNFDALDASLLNGTIWNYTSDNTNERGDLWNDEDLSLFSRDQQDKDWREDIHAGGRGLAGFVRPYARRVAGEPLRMAFDTERRTFELDFRPDAGVAAPTEVFVPDYVYPNGFTVEVEGGRWWADRATMTLFVETPGGLAIQMVRIRPK